MSRNTFQDVSIEMVAANANLSRVTVGDFTTMHEIGSALLDHERARMADIQRIATATTEDPIARIIIAFRAVGTMLLNDSAARAGVRIASEARQLFPERRLNPYLTWRDFLHIQLTAAHNEHLIAERTSIDTFAQSLVAAGVSLISRLVETDEWEHAPTAFDGTATRLLNRVLNSRSHSDPIARY